MIYQEEKDPLIVCADSDLEAAARAAMWGGFLNTCQVGTSIERVNVELELYEPFLERLVELTRTLIVGSGIDPESEVTPMIRPNEREKVAQQVQKTQSKGALIHTGGRIPVDKTKGFYYEPTVFSQVTEDMLVMQEETFGPVLPVVPVMGLKNSSKPSMSIGRLMAV